MGFDPSTYIPADHEEEQAIWEYAQNNNGTQVSVENQAAGHRLSQKLYKYRRAACYFMGEAGSAPVFMQFRVRIDQADGGGWRVSIIPHVRYTPRPLVS